ncbi:uncharacterized protein LOC128238992 isoform X2 [Mya arenaria]|uniref:uncharacterized protein LOC128238992 isoform X2 n=1 Tax=Mya arenaria TaxID=6604 RepID=UPI0022E4DD2E|nr:uncharacterized protein LOC128238992 isoform X2 [Mya arenaria]
MSNNSSKNKSNKFYKENNYSWYKQDQDGKWHCVVCRRAKLKSAYVNGHDQPAKTTSHQRHSISNQHNAAVEKTIVPSVCFITVPVVDMPEVTAVKQHININVCDKCILCTFSFKRIEATPRQTINHDKNLNRKLKLTRERLKDITYIVPDIKKKVASIAQGVCVKCYKKVQTIIRKEKEIKKDKKAMIDLYRQVNVASITLHSTSGKSKEEVFLPKKVVLEETKSKTATEPSVAVHPMDSTDVNQNDGRVMMNVESTVAECEPYVFELPVDGQAVNETIKEEPTDTEHLLAFDIYANAIHLDGQATNDDVKKEPLDTDHMFASNTVSNNILLHGQEISNQNIDTPASATHALASGNASDIPSCESNLPEPQIKVEPNINSYTFDIETDSPNHQVSVETEAMKNELDAENCNSRWNQPALVKPPVKRDRDLQALRTKMIMFVRLVARSSNERQRSSNMRNLFIRETKALIIVVDSGFGNRVTSNDTCVVFMGGRRFIRVKIVESRSPLKQI